MSSKARWTSRVQSVGSVHTTVIVVEELCTCVPAIATTGTSHAARRDQCKHASRAVARIAMARADARTTFILALLEYLYVTLCRKQLDSISFRAISAISAARRRSACCRVPLRSCSECACTAPARFRGARANIFRIYFQRPSLSPHLQRNHTHTHRVAPVYRTNVHLPLQLSRRRRSFLCEGAQVQVQLKH